jgi:hypothetical protein
LILPSKFVSVTNFRWRQWGISLQVLYMLNPPLIPPSTPAKIFGRIFLRGGVKKLKSFLITFRAILSTFHFFNNKKRGGAGGVPKIFFSHPKSYFIYVLLKTIFKISKPYNYSVWETSNEAERREKDEIEKTPLIVDP